MLEERCNRAVETSETKYLACFHIDGVKNEEAAFAAASSFFMFLTD